MSLVVTGATGRLGRLVVESLLARGTAPAEVVATGRSAARLAPLAARGVRTAVVDFDDPTTIAPVLDAGDVVLLVSGSEVGRRVPQHQNVLDAAVAAGVARLVYTSAPHADTSPLILAPEHKATEEAIAASGLTSTILRNGWYTENYAPQVEEARATGAVVSSAGEGRVASASRADYAEAAAVVMTSDGYEDAVLELSGDVAWTYDDLAEALSAVVARPVVYRPVDADQQRAHLLAAGLDAATVGFVVALDADTRAGLLADTSGDLARVLGRPTTPLLQGLRDLGPTVAE